MKEVTKFTDYIVYSPDWFIDFLQEELNKRDLRGLTNNRINYIKVTGEHPLVSIVNSIIQNGNTNTSNILPAISVVESDETEENTTVGEGLRSYEFLNKEGIEIYKEKPMKDRIYDGLITDSQIETLENAICESPNGKLLIETHEFYQHESIFLSLWAHNIQEKNIIGNLLRSIAYDMRKTMLNTGLIEVKVKTSKGLVNTNFGRVIYGQESEIEYRNTIRNYTVYSDYDINEIHVVGNFTTTMQEETVERIIY